MPQFSYTSINKEGKQVSGVVAAPTREEAIAEIRKSGSRPLLLREVKARKKRMSFKNKVKIKDLVVFSRELSTMITAGVSLPRTLSTLAEQAENPFFKEVIMEVNHDVESGIGLGDALAKHPNVFNDVYVNMVRAGESGGILDDIMKRLAMQVEKEASIRHKVRGAMAYPVVIMTVTVIAFFAIMLFIMPKIGKVISELGGSGASLPIYTRAMLGVSNFLIDSSLIGFVPVINKLPLIGGIPNIFFFVIAFVIFIMWFRRYIRTDKGRLWWHYRLLHAPLIGKVITKIIVARFARTFSSLMGAGVSVLDSLEITGKAVGNRVIQKELDDIAKSVKNGQPLGRQFLTADYFPPIVGQMMQVGEETGKTDEILLKVADFYEEEVDTVIDSLASIIEPVMIVVLGGFVGLIAASVMGPIAGLSQQIGN
jgi:type IV pilus assembly protein PilC